MKVVIRRSSNFLLQAKNGTWRLNTNNKFFQYIAQMFIHNKCIRHESKILVHELDVAEELDKMKEHLQKCAGDIALEFEVIA